MQYVLNDELNRRIISLQERLRNNNYLGALIFNKVNLFYFSGTAQNGMMFVPVSGEPILLVRKDFNRACEESPLENILKFDNFSSILDKLNSFGFTDLSRIGIEQDVLPTDIFLRLNKLFPQSVLMDASGIIKQIKMCKSAYEQEVIRLTSNINKVGYEKAKEVLKEGITELELAAHVEFAMRLVGHEKNLKMHKEGGVDFLTVSVFSGINANIASFIDAPLGGKGLSPATPFGTSNKRIIRGEPVVIDLSSSYYGYTVDQTRTIAIEKLSKELIRGYELTLKILHWVKENLKPGRICEDIYFGAIALADESPYGKYFMGYGNSKVSFIGHGVGLELDEPPYLAKGYKVSIQPGMVVAVEPKIVIPNVGAVGIENTYLVTEKEAECLTDISEEIVII